MSDAIEILKRAFPKDILDGHQAGNRTTVTITRDILVPCARFVKESPGLSFRMLMDIAGVDYPGRNPRFEVVYIFYSLEFRQYLTVKVQVPEGACEVDSLCGLWKGANWSEREVYDLFGIRFRGHPKLRRILCHDEFVGHALRKDYDIRKGQWLSRAYDPR